MKANLSALQTKIIPIVFGLALFVVAFSAVKGMVYGNVSNVKLLAGLIVCGHCGARYSKISKLKKSVKNGSKRYNKYCCKENYCINSQTHFCHLQNICHLII